MPEEKVVLVPIGQEYIDWVKENNGDLSAQETAEYINDVLAEHKASWDELEE